MNKPIILYILPSWWPWLAIALAGVILAKKGRKLSEQTITHEQVHFRQQWELLIVGFFVLYALEFLFRFVACGFRWMEAYRNISFEREADDLQGESFNLVLRPPYNWIRYL